MEALHVVKKLAADCGDEFEIHEYKRFNEMKVLEESIKDEDYTADSVREGDAIVAFSNKDIFSIRAQIEKNTNFKCCVVYGALPPETRANQGEQMGGS